MSKLIFALLFTILLSFIACRDEEYIKGLQRLKKLFLNDTEFPEDYSKFIKTLRFHSKIEVQSFNKDTDPSFLLKFGIEKEVAQNIIEEGSVMDQSNTNYKNITTDIKKGVAYIKYHGYNVNTVMLNEQKQFLAATSFECVPEFFPQYIAIKKCKTILGFHFCKTTYEKKPFMMTDELQELVVKSTNVLLNQKIVKQINIKIEEMS